MRENFNTQCSREQLIDTLAAVAFAHHQGPNPQDGDALKATYNVFYHVASNAFGVPNEGKLRESFNDLRVNNFSAFDDAREAMRERIERVEEIEGARWRGYYERADEE